MFNGNPNSTSNAGSSLDDGRWGSNKYAQHLTRDEYDSRVPPNHAGDDEENDGDEGIIPYHRDLLWCLDGGPCSRCCPMPRQNLRDMTETNRAPFLFIILLSILLVEILGGFLRYWLQNVAASRVKPETASNLASGLGILVAYIPRIASAIILLAYSAVQMWRGRRLNLMEIVTIASTCVVASIATQLMLRTPWFGVVCHCFGGDIPTVGLHIMCIMMAIVLHGHFGTFASLVVPVVVSAILISSSLYNFTLVKAISGSGFFATSLESCVLPSNPSEIYDTESIAAVTSPLFATVDIAGDTAIAMFVALRADFTRWLMLLALKGARRLTKLASSGQRWAQSAAERILPRILLPSMKDNRRLPSAYELSDRTNTTLEPILTASSNSRSIHSVASSSNMISSHCASLPQVTIVIIRLGVMRKLGHILGPRVMFNFIQKLGKAADLQHSQEGGRRLRTWYDGIMIGFGIDNASPNQYAHPDTSPVYAALRACQNILCEMAVAQAEAGMLLGAQAIIHVGPANVGLFGTDPRVLDCNGSATDVAIMLSERVAEAYRDHLRSLYLSQSAMELVQAVVPGIAVLFSKVHDPFSGNMQALLRASQWCSASFQSMLASVLRDGHDQPNSTASKSGSVALNSPKHNIQGYFGGDFEPDSSYSSNANASRSEDSSNQGRSSQNGGALNVSRLDRIMAHSSALGKMYELAPWSFMHGKDETQSSSDAGVAMASRGGLELSADVTSANIRTSVRPRVDRLVNSAGWRSLPHDMAFPLE